MQDQGFDWASVSYVFSTGFQRDNGLILQRVPESGLTDSDAWQGWGFANGTWGWGRSPTLVLTGAYGELCLRRVEDRWLPASASGTRRAQGCPPTGRRLRLPARARLEPSRSGRAH